MVQKAPAVVVKWEYITPALAAEYLAASVGNRAIRQHRIAQLKRDLLNGLFVPTHHPLAFDIRGAFVDGHHRCRAIAESGVAAWLLVARGVSVASLAYVDGNLPRSIRDAILLIGERDHLQTREVAIANAIESMPRAAYAQYSRQEVISVLSQAADAIALAASGMKLRGITRGVRTVIARAELREPHNSRTKEFMTILLNGMPTSANSQEDTAAITYRNWLLRVAGHTGQMLELERYRKGQVCLRAFLDRVPMSKVYGTADDLFPLPDGWQYVINGN